MTTPRQLLDRRKRRGTNRHKRLVIDLNEDVCSVWSPDTGIVAEPSRAAITLDGRVGAFGFEADLVTGKRDGEVITTNLFDPHGCHRQLETRFLAWLLKRSGVGPIGGIPVFVPLNPSVAQEEQNHWCRVIDNMGGDVVVIHRPIAAAMALGLDVDERSCHLMIEVLQTHLELAFVRAGSVAESLRVERHNHTLIRRFVEETLTALDPDEELQVRDSGVCVYGWSALRHVRETITAVGLPLSRPIGGGPTVLNGARAMADIVLPWLAPQ